MEFARHYTIKDRGFVITSDNLALPIRFGRKTRLRQGYHYQPFTFDDQTLAEDQDGAFYHLAKGIPTNPAIIKEGHFTDSVVKGRAHLLLYRTTGALEYHVVSETEPEREVEYGFGDIITWIGDKETGAVIMGISTPACKDELEETIPIDSKISEWRKIPPHYWDLYHRLSINP